MTSNEHNFFGILLPVPKDVFDYATRMADYIEQQSTSLATELRVAIDSATWIPDSMRPPLQIVSHHRFITPTPPESLIAQSTKWISKNRTTVAVVLAFVGATAIFIHRRKRAHARKRRARRDRNGKKKEIVVLACSSFHDPLTRSLALDLDRRGYVVYATVSSTEEDRLVQSESKWDIRPLWMDLASVPKPGLEIHPHLEPIRQLIKPDSRSSSPSSEKSSQSPSISSPLTLAGLILLPGSAGYPTGPVSALQPTDLVDTINTRLITPMLTVQQFLPLLSLAEKQSELSLPRSTLNTAKPQTTSSRRCPSIILAYPSIPTSLNPPNQTPETITTASLSAFTRSLRREISPTSLITVTELKLGLFDLSSLAPPRPKAGEYVYPGTREEGLQPSRKSALTHWHSSQRAAARGALGASLQQGDAGDNTTDESACGSSLREFHNAVFDALNPSPGFKAFGVIPWGGRRRGAGTTVYVGQGARVHDLIGTLVPDGLVSWMIRRQETRGNYAEEAGLRQGNDRQENEEEEEEGRRGRGQELGVGIPNWGVSSNGSASEVWERL